MSLFPGQTPPPTKRILLYTVIAVIVLILVGYFFPGESPFQS